MPTNGFMKMAHPAKQKEKKILKMKSKKEKRNNSEIENRCTTKLQRFRNFKIKKKN